MIRESVEVKEGYATIVVEGEAPTKPMRFMENLDLEVQRAKWDVETGGWRVTGEVDPFNFVWVNEEQVEVNEDGTFRLDYDRLPDGLITIRVLTPLGSTKTTYTFLRNKPFPIQLRGEENEFAG